MELIEILQNAAQAAQKLKNEPLSKRDDFLLVLKAQLEGNVDIIIEGNKKDIEGLGAENPMRDRLKLDENRILAMAASLEDIRVMSDPLGLVLEDRNVESGLHLKKVTVPLGVVGVIYESRPNVTIDVAALCVKSGNVAVLRGGSDAHETNKVLYDLINKALYEAGLDVDCVTLLDTDRELVKQLLNADEYVDVVIPRGGQSLIDMVRENSRVPVIETGAGVVHIYVDSEVDIDRAASVVVNAKTDRPAVCNALDTLIIHADIMQQFLANVLPQLEKFEVKIYADDASFEFVSGKYNQELVQLATDESFGMEYLSMQMALRIVSNLDEAIDHIARYSSKHSESILTDNKAHASEFLERVDAAVVYVNTSTRFTDGGVFGLGAEIGISTQKLHARGPMGVRELTTYKWQVESDYAVR